MTLPTLTPAQQDELQVARDAIQRDFAAQHRATCNALLSATPTQLHAALRPWYEALVALSDEVVAWQLAAEQADVPELSRPTELPHFQALAAIPLDTDAERALLGACAQLGELRVLALAALIELARTCDDQATWVLLDWLDADDGVLGTLAASRQRAAQTRDDATRVQADDATQWLVQRGFEHTAPFNVSIRMQDLPPNHPKQRHLREQVSALEITISTRSVRSPDLDVSWALALRGGSGATLHGFTPSRWSGNFWQVQRDTGALSANFTEPGPSAGRKPRTHTILATLESLPTVIDEIETFTERSFHRDSATVSASIGEQRSTELEAGVRAWLAGAR
jgi:hypothetical protein